MALLAVLAALVAGELVTDEATLAQVKAALSGTTWQPVLLAGLAAADWDAAGVESLGQSGAKVVYVSPADVDARCKEASTGKLPSKALVVVDDAEAFPDLRRLERCVRFGGAQLVAFTECSVDQVPDYISRLFPLQLTLELPSEVDRKKFILSQLRSRTHELSVDDVGSIASLTRGFTYGRLAQMLLRVKDGELRADALEAAMANLPPLTPYCFPGTASAAPAGAP